MDRKEFIQNIFRFSILGLMAVIVGIFISRDKIRAGSECPVSYACRSCGKLNKCALPEAEKYRNHGKG